MPPNDEQIDLTEFYFTDEEVQEAVDAWLKQAWDEDAKREVAKEIYDGYSWAWRATNFFSYVEDEQQPHFTEAQEAFEAVKAQLDLSNQTSNRTDNLSAQEVTDAIQTRIQTLAGSSDANIALVLEKAGINPQSAARFIQDVAAQKQQEAEALVKAQTTIGKETPTVTRDNFQNYLEQQFDEAISDDSNHTALAEHVIQLANAGKLYRILDDKTLESLNGLDPNNLNNLVVGAVINGLSNNTKAIAEHITQEVFGNKLLIEKDKIGEDHDVYVLLPSGIIDAPNPEDFDGRIYQAPTKTAPAAEEAAPAGTAQQDEPAVDADQQQSAPNPDGEPASDPNPPATEPTSAPAPGNTITMAEVNTTQLDEAQVKALIGEAVDQVLSGEEYDQALLNYLNANRTDIPQLASLDKDIDQETFKAIKSALAQNKAAIIVHFEGALALPENSTTTEVLTAINREFGKDITILDAEIAAAVAPGKSLSGEAGQAEEPPETETEPEAYPYTPSEPLPPMSDFAVPISFEYETGPLHTAQLKLRAGRSYYDEEVHLSAEQAEALAQSLLRQGYDENNEQRKVRREIKELVEQGTLKLDDIGLEEDAKLGKALRNNNGLAFNYLQEQVNTNLQAAMGEQESLTVAQVVEAVNNALPEGIEVEAKESVVKHVIRTNPILETVNNELGVEEASGRMIAKSYLEAQTAMLGDSDQGYMHVPLMHAGIDNDQLQQFLQANPAFDQVTRLVEQNLAQLFQSEYGGQILTTLQAKYPSELGHVDDPERLIYGIGDLADTFMGEALSYLDGKPLTAHNLEVLFQQALQTQILPHMTFDNKTQAGAAETRLRELVSITEVELRDVGFGKTTNEQIASASQTYAQEQENKKQSAIASYVSNFINSMENPSPVLQLIANFIPQILELVDQFVPGLMAKVDNLVTPDEGSQEINPALQARGDKPEIILAAAEPDETTRPSATPAVPKPEEEHAVQPAGRSA